MGNDKGYKYQMSVGWSPHKGYSILINAPVNTEEELDNGIKVAIEKTIKIVDYLKQKGLDKPAISIGRKGGGNTKKPLGKCEKCSGNIYSEKVIEFSNNKHGKTYCYNCSKGMDESKPSVDLDDILT